MTERLAEIKAKCEQYLGYQGESVGMSEVHAVLSFIHGRTVEAIAEVERLEAAMVEAGKKLESVAFVGNIQGKLVLVGDALNILRSTGDSDD